MKTLFSSLSHLALFLLLSTTFIACDKDDDDDSNSSKTIAQIVIDDANFSVLEAAVVKAGLASALSSGNLTVFAPDNSAFAASGITEATITALPVSSVDSILKYHVLGAKVMASGVPVSDTVKTLLGTNIYASNNANGVFVNGIKVKTADVQASNGVIHVIERVLTPPTRTIAQIAAASPDLSLLVAAVVKAGLLTAVSSAGKYTVFAPTNAAFNTAGFATANDINNAPANVITNVVKYHVLGTSVFASDLVAGATPATLQPGTVTIGLTPSANVKVSGSANAASGITVTNIVATNGVVHIIDRVLLP